MDKGTTVKELNEYLQERVQQLTRHKGKQTPWVICEPIEKSDLILIPKYATTNDDKNEIEEDLLTPIDEKIKSPKLLEDSTRVQLDIALGHLEEYPTEPETDNLNWQVEESKEPVMTLQEILQETERLKQLDNQSNTQNKSHKFSWKKILGYTISGMILLLGTNLISFNRQLQIIAQLSKAPAPNLNYGRTNRVEFVNETINNSPELQNLAIQQFNQNDIRAGKLVLETLLEQGELAKVAEAIDAVPEKLSDHPEINFLKGRLVWELFPN